MRSVIRTFDIRIHVEMAGMALEHLAVLLQLILVVGDELVRGVVRPVFQRDHFQPEAEA